MLRDGTMVRQDNSIAEGRVLHEAEKLALQRVRRAGVKAPASAIVAWIRSVGPTTILAAKLCDIRGVASAF